MESKHYKYWKSIEDLKRCVICGKNHGKIYLLDELVDPEPPIHEYCRCIINRLKSIIAGNATKNGSLGADLWLKEFGKLPPYYISISEAKKLGWKSALGNLNSVAPGKMLAKGIYENRNGHLPSAPNRVWYEADIDYTSGYRGISRILHSNDGLIFVTYDHYQTFSEIV